MKKRKTNAFGKDVYLLGKDEDGNLLDGTDESR